MEQDATRRLLESSHPAGKNIRIWVTKSFHGFIWLFRASPAVSTLFRSVVPNAALQYILL